MIDGLKEKERKYNDLEQEKEIAVQDKIRAERQVVSHHNRHEDEVRTRIDLEVKINKLYNTNLSMKNHTVTLNSKVTEYEHLIESLKEYGRNQEAEIVSLRSYKAHTEFLLGENKIRIEEARK